MQGRRRLACSYERVEERQEGKCADPHMCSGAMGMEGGTHRQEISTAAPRTCHDGKYKPVSDGVPGQAAFTFLPKQGYWLSNTCNSSA